MELQPVFIANIQAVYGKAGKSWLARLPVHLENLAKRWQFRLIAVMPNLTYSFVALVELNKNQEVVILKTAPPSSSIISEAKWLSSFAHGVPLVFELDEANNAVLMERLNPGVTLKSLVAQGQDERATQIICQTIMTLRSAQRTYLPFKHVSGLAQSLPMLQGHLKNALITKAESLFHDLSADCKQDVLLHGDLHHDNILASGEIWKVIDPHGYLGDPAAEVGAMFYNPIDCFPAGRPLHNVIDSRLRLVAETLPFDARRMQAWAFCWTLLSAAWDVGDYGKILNNKTEIALAIEKVKL